MIKRPAPGDTEQDILQMQKDFLLEQYKNQNFEPAAKVVKSNTTATRKPSSFAQKRAQEKLAKSGAAEEKDGDEVNVKNNESGENESMSGVQVEAHGYQPIIGDIIEREDGKGSNVKVRHSDDLDQGFPKPTRLNRSKLEGSSSKSLFAMTRAKMSTSSVEPMDIPSTSAASSGSSIDFGSKSYILTGESDQKIHDENVQTLRSMNEKDILDQRQQLLESMDPDLIKFLRSKRTSVQQPPKTTTIVEDKPDLDSTSVQNASTLDILDDPNYEQWPNFDIVEPAKLEWMKDVNQQLPELKPGETFEARFDWKGVLLPYALPDASADDRELYLHGDDAQRPGYTMQELFRLARSNVAQQRISAITAIAGLLSIHQQGFYDSVLDVPISKIFFLLRFAFDENAPAMLEVTSRALAALFHNDADEVLLDFVRDCSSDFREPVLSVSAGPPAKAATVEGPDGEDLEQKFAKIELEKRARKFETTLAGGEGDEEELRDALNDFHLAEIDLVDCFVRTNIMQRIKYILFTVRPENATVIHCLKILVRLARSGYSVTCTLFEIDFLQGICDHFLVTGGQATSKYYGQPQYLAMKLVRILASYGREWIRRIALLGASDILQHFVLERSEITVSLIKIQVEAFRLAKVMVIADLKGSLYGQLTSGLLYMLEWSYQFLKFDQPSHLLFRQHAAALVTLISSTGPSLSSGRFTEKLQMCCSKWFHQATVNGAPELSQTMLLSACLNACTRISGEVFHEFYSRYLIGFLRSSHYKTICSDLPTQTPLLRKISTRDNQHKALPHLNSVIVNTATKSPAYIITQKYAAHLLTSVFKLLQALHVGQHLKLFTEILPLAWTPELNAHLHQLATQPTNEHLRRNWFIRPETDLMLNLIRCGTLSDSFDRTDLQKIAYRVSTYLTEDQSEDAFYLFDSILFEPTLFARTEPIHSGHLMTIWKQIYTYLCCDVDTPDDGGLMVCGHDKLMLAAEWPYLPLLKVLEAVMTANTDRKPEIHERDFLVVSLAYTSLQKANGLDFITPTEELIFLMICHLGPESTFLEPGVRAMIAERVRQLFDANRETVFTFDDPRHGSVTFENLFLLFVDHFEGTSYGDPVFGALLMVPLSQKYDARWRRLVWSEHLNAIRFIQCNEAQLIGTLDDYLYPVETDVTMLKFYYQAVNSITFAEGSIPRRIAEHHLQKHREAVDERKRAERAMVVDGTSEQ